MPKNSFLNLHSKMTENYSKTPNYLAPGYPEALSIWQKSLGPKMHKNSKKTDEKLPDTEITKCQPSKTKLPPAVNTVTLTSIITTFLNTISVRNQ